MPLHDLRDAGDVGRSARIHDGSDFLEENRAKQPWRDDAQPASQCGAAVIKPVDRAARNEQHIARTNGD